MNENLHDGTSAEIWEMQEPSMLMDGRLQFKVVIRSRDPWGASVVRGYVLTMDENGGLNVSPPDEEKAFR
jgi:hypothetical protein